MQFSFYPFWLKVETLMVSYTGPDAACIRKVSLVSTVFTVICILFSITLVNINFYCQMVVVMQKTKFAYFSEPSNFLMFWLQADV